MHTDARVVPRVPGFVDDELQRPDRERLIRFIFQKRDASALVLLEPEISSIKACRSRGADVTATAGIKPV
jgi:hypothetical protein